MKKTYTTPAMLVVRIMHRGPLLISSTGNDKSILYGGEGIEEPR
jgi:hypothetical protein